jgi:MFS family permease
MEEVAQEIIAYHGHVVPYYPPHSTQLTSAPLGTRIKKFFQGVLAGGIVGGIIGGIGAGAGWQWLIWTGVAIGALIVIAGIYTAFTLRLGKCPYCHQEFGRAAESNLTSGDDNAQAECTVCTSWLISHKGELRAFTKADVKEDTEFKCKVMERATWANECLVCGAPPTRFIELKNTNLNATSLLVGRISVSWGSLKNAPYCNYHEDAVKLKIEDKEMFLKFPDFEMMRRYQHVNYHLFMTGKHL